MFLSSPVNAKNEPLKDGWKIVALSKKMCYSLRRAQSTYITFGVAWHESKNKPWSQTFKSEGTERLSCQRNRTSEPTLSHVLLAWLGLPGICLAHKYARKQASQEEKYATQSL